ncbi:hypothetical protein BW43_02904 [Pseudomonas sp. RIT357]|nr:hypothetical protein BW43_02904 [Pseudomonas sp. RIT357]
MDENASTRPPGEHSSTGALPLMARVSSNCSDNTRLV